MIKKLSAVAAAASLALALTACGSSSSGDDAAAGKSCDTPTEITFLGTIKVEIQDQFLAAVDDYNASQTCYKVVSVPSQGDSLMATLTTMYAAGNLSLIHI